MRVQFIHGLESSPRGDKARYLARHFDALTPDMDTGDFLGCLQVQAEAIQAFRPDVLVGSSFGGALAVMLSSQGAWSGPTLLLAPAALKLDPTARLPVERAVLIVHGTRDEVVPIEDARRLAQTGSPGRVALLEVDDTHRLASLLADDAEPSLRDLVRRAQALGAAGEERG